MEGNRSTTAGVAMGERRRHSPVYIIKSGFFNTKSGFFNTMLTSTAANGDGGLFNTKFIIFNAKFIIYTAVAAAD